MFKDQAVVPDKPLPKSQTEMAALDQAARFVQNKWFDKLKKRKERKMSVGNSSHMLGGRGSVVGSEEEM